MPATARAVKAGGYYHALNRGNGRQVIFHKDADYDAFARVLAEGLARYPVELLAWCLMPNPWHLVVRPGTPDEMSTFMGWVGVTHVRRHHERYHTRGGGHLYQERFKSFPVQSDTHFRTVCRYVEANPKRAKLVERAEDWRWSSLAAHPAGVGRDGWPPLAKWPVDRPIDWTAWVNDPLGEEETAAVRASVDRGRPFGDAGWVAAAAGWLGLGHTLRRPGRPRKRSVADRGDA